MKVEARWKWYELLIHPVAVMEWGFKGDSQEKQALIEKHADVAAYYANYRQYIIAWGLLWSVPVVAAVVAAVVMILTGKVASDMDNTWVDNALFTALIGCILTLSALNWIGWTRVCG